MSSPSLGPIRAVAKFFFDGSENFYVKGVHYGPFRPDPDGVSLGNTDRRARAPARA